MRRNTKAIVVGAVIGAAVAIPTMAQAGRSNDDGNEQKAPIGGSYLDEASRVALEHMGEGRVTSTEVGDEESYYEIEVTLDDGTQVDVQLTEDFRVVSAFADQEETD